MMSANNAGAAVWARWGNEPSSKLLPDPVRLPSPLPPNRGGGVVSIAFDASTSSLIERYLRVCRELQVAPCPGVLTFIRLRLAELKPERWNGGSGHIKFGDIEMYAFCDFVLREKAPCAIFEHWTHFDGQGCDFGSTGCQMLARVLGLPESCVHTVDLRNQQIGERGTRALTEVLRVNPRVVHVGLYASFISDAGAKLIVDFLREGGEGVRALETLDLSLNMVSFDMCQELQLVRPAELKLVLKGNRVLDEVLNASSHCVGVILVILGTVFLGISVADKPELSLGPDGAVLSNSGYVASISIYLISLFCLYLASTLYHSMFAMGDAVLTVFAVFDQSAIYLLIAGAYTPFLHVACLPHCMLMALPHLYLLVAGSYTPFLTILFPDKPMYSTGLLGFLWLMALLGIVLHLTYYGPFKTGLQVSTYIGMGWAALVCIQDINDRLGAIDKVAGMGTGVWLLFVGGFLYTVGVPFFVRDKRTIGIPDHTIWHLFVMAASAAHYYCVLLYLVPFPYEGVPLPWADACGEACIRV